MVEAYSYDANGNRLTSTNSAGTFAATYDDQDRIETYGSIEYTFTLNGELLNRTDTATNESTDFVYDAMGNLREVTLPNGDVIEYLVDGQGRRVGKFYNGVLERRWLWRGMLQPVAELNAAGDVVARFVYGRGTNTPELMVTSGATYHLVKDRRGSIRRVMNAATGAAVQELDYDAFGRVVLDTSPGFQPFGFSGGLYGPDTGLVRFGARDFDAEAGRWTARDPARFDGGANHYAYVNNNPVHWLDPWGLCDAGDGGCSADSGGDGSGNGSYAGPPGPPDAPDPDAYPDDPNGTCEEPCDPWNPFPLWFQAASFGCTQPKRCDPPEWCQEQFALCEEAAKGSFQQRCCEDALKNCQLCPNNPDPYSFVACNR